MKKLMGILAILLSVVGLAACAPKTVDERIKANISELRLGVWEAADEQVQISFYTGIKEAPFVTDGKHNGTKEFGVLSVQPTLMGAGEWSYVLKSGEQEYSGKMTLHPFGMSYEADIKKQVEGIITVSISGPNDFKKELTLESKIANDMIDWERALLIATNRLNNEVSAMFEGEKFNAEVYVRFVGNMTDIDKDYYWYVAFVDKDGKSVAALINPLNGEVCAVS